MTLHWARVRDHDLPMPARETAGAGGYDLQYCGDESLMLWVGDQEIVPTGWAAAVPDGWVGLIWPRSGLAVRAGLSVGAGVIDSDYRGEIKVLLQRPVSRGCNPEPLRIRPGDRIAQMVVMPYLQESTESMVLPATGRGADGFGSTGR